MERVTFRNFFDSILLFASPPHHRLIFEFHENNKLSIKSQLIIVYSLHSAFFVLDFELS